MWVLGIKFRLSGRAAKAAKPPLHPFPLFMCPLIPPLYVTWFFCIGRSGPWNFVCGPISPTLWSLLGGWPFSSICPFSSIAPCWLPAQSLLACRIQGFPGTRAYWQCCYGVSFPFQLHCLYHYQLLLGSIGSQPDSVDLWLPHRVAHSDIWLSVWHLRVED